jgi:hypothetical protein
MKSKVFSINETLKLLPVIKSSKNIYLTQCLSYNRGLFLYLTSLINTIFHQIHYITIEHKSGVKLEINILFGSH